MTDDDDNNTERISDDDDDCELITELGQQERAAERIRVQARIPYGAVVCVPN